MNGKAFAAIHFMSNADSDDNRAEGEWERER